MAHTWQIRPSRAPDAAHRSDDSRTGDVRSSTGPVRCTFCAIANTTVGVLIGLAPVAAPLLSGRAELAVWGLPLTLLILGYTARRVGRIGFLPGADRIAHATGLSRVVGPAASDTTATDPATPQRKRATGTAAQVARGTERGASLPACEARKGGSNDEQC